jgi:hypothetical protein
VSDFLAVVDSVDCGFDAKVGTNSDQEDILDLTPDCKYVKYVQVTSSLQKAIWRLANFSTIGRFFILGSSVEYFVK